MAKLMKVLKRVFLAAVVAASACATPAGAQITFDLFVDPHPTVAGGTIGFAFAGNKFVGSAQADGFGVLYSTDLSGGNLQPFAANIAIPGGNYASEHAIAGSLGLGGFPSRDLYVAAGNAVLHISNDGTRSDLLVTGLSGAVDALIFDAVGTFGHDLLLSTTAGNIYRVDSSGRALLIASISAKIEGLDVAPLGAGFGRFDGQLIIVGESDGLVRAVSLTGTVTVLNQATPIPQPETITFVPLDLGASGSPVEGLYGAMYPNTIMKADISQFRLFKGDAIVRTESLDQRISRMHWNGQTFEITVIGFNPAEGEGALFVSPTMINPGVDTCPGNSGKHDSPKGSRLAPRSPHRAQGLS
jgi:hypothetical protein